MSDFLGLPIAGERQQYSTPLPPQEDPAKLLAAIQSVLDHPLAEAVRWEEFTPYFNDGDACEFTVHSARVKLVGLEDGGDYDDGFYDYFELTYYDEVKSLDGVHDLKSLLQNLDNALGSGHHEAVLLEKFGDPAQVTATKDGFEIEYYEHD